MTASNTASRRPNGTTKAERSKHGKEVVIARARIGRQLACIAGRGIRLWWRIAKPRTLGVKGYVQNDRGEILLVRTSYEGHWSLPGGGVEKHEHPRAAILRELREETGLDPTRLSDIALVAAFVSVAEGKADTILLYRMLSSAASIVPQAEIAAAGFFPPDALPAPLSPAASRRISELHTAAPQPDTW